MRHPRGLTMIEMMIAVSLLAVVGLVTAQVFRGTMNVHRDTTAAHDALGRTQRLGEVLRRDVWRAGGIEIAGGDARLVHPDGDVVTWRIDAGTILLREAAGATERWQLAMPVALEREGPSVVLTLGDEAAGRRARMRFVSQVMLAGEER